MVGSLTEPGVWTTFIPVSLGAPFWQGLLDKLLGLRSQITDKTRNQRAQARRADLGRPKDVRCCVHSNGFW